MVMLMAIKVDELLENLLKINTGKTLTAIFIFACLFPSYANSGVWQISPSIDMLETYTDNVRLASSGNEKSDYITQLNPGITLIGTSPKIKLNAKYVLQNYAYTNDKNQNRTNQLLNATSKIELLDELFYIEAKSVINQKIISPLGPLTTDNTNIINDRAEVRSNSISPFIKHDTSNNISSEIRYTHSTLETSASGLLNSKEDDIFLSVKSGAPTSKITLELGYKNKNIDYTNSNFDSINEKSSFGIAYRISSKLQLTSAAGYEKFNYISSTQKPEGPYWLLGFSWAPSERSSIIANGGKRFLGENYSLMANHRARRSVWSLGYNEDITDTRSQFLIPATIDTSSFLNQLLTSSIPDPIIRQQIVNTFIIDNGLSPSLANPVNFLTNRIFLQKQLQASMAITGAKNTILFSLFNTQRESLTSQTADSALFGLNSSALSDKSIQIGSSILWNYKATPHSSLVTNIGYVKSIFASLNTDFTTKSISINLNKVLQPKLNGTLGLRHTLRESAQGVAGYRESAVTASLQYLF